MSVFKCKMCGGTIEFQPGETVGICDSCGTKQTLPRLDDDKKANLYDRANHFRRNNDFDKAASIYEQILNEDPNDAETYWSLVLCRYGIEYVEDPATRKRVPTVNRAQFTSIFDDDNYKLAIEHADGSQRELYEAEAKTINDIQKGILSISQKEEPFDVFICYKETDNNGRRTQDSVLANDLYHQLTQEGFKVFFSRITLEDKLGTAYEPYIFAALNSAKVMVVLGTKPEYFNAVWVKNEWSRYLALVKQSGGKKVLIPAYKDMDPYDLPEEFSHLQAQDMSKLGFMQDLIRGIKKIVASDAPKTIVKETVPASVSNTNAEPLLKRAFMFLEDGNWQEADSYCEKVLDQDPENAQAYLGKLMAELHVSKQEQLADNALPFEDRNSYIKAMRFGGSDIKSLLTGAVAHIKDRNENTRITELYNQAVNAMSIADTEYAYKTVAEKFKALAGFRAADDLAGQCLEKAEICRKDTIYESAKALMAEDKIISYEKAAVAFHSIQGWKDSDELKEIARRKAKELIASNEIARKKRSKTIKIAVSAAIACIAIVVLLVKVIIPSSKYKKAESLVASGNFDEAIAIMAELGEYKDAYSRISEFYYKKAEAALVADDYELAYDSFLNAGDYNDAKSRLGEGYYNHASKLISNGLYEEALKYMAGIKLPFEWLYDKRIESYYLMGEKALSNGNNQKAYDCFANSHKYLDSDEKKSLAAEREGDHLSQVGDFDGAIQWYERAVKSEKSNPLMYEYVKNNYNNMDEVTARYLDLLKARNYMDSAKLYEQLYRINITIMMTHKICDDWNEVLANAVNEYRHGQYWTAFYFWIKVDGGRPDIPVNLTIKSYRKNSNPACNVEKTSFPVIQQNGYTYVDGDSKMVNDVSVGVEVYYEGNLIAQKEVNILR